MEFGKVSDPDRVRYELPANDPRSAEILSHSPQLRTNGTEPKVYFGGPVWACREWVGKIYPRGTPAKDYLKSYARTFNAIELNSTFYRVPERKTVQEWVSTTPAGFRFSPKIPQQISRSDDLGAGSPLLLETCRAFSGFADRLGTSFLQLPPTFDVRKLPTLSRFLRHWPKELPVAIEFRNPSWFSKHQLRTDAFDLLASHGTVAAITDTPGRRDLVHASLTSRRAFIRFSGNELHPSDFLRIDRWVTRLGEWFASGVQEVSFFMHHPTYVNVPELCQDFASKMNRECGLHLPEIHLESPGQMDLL